MTVLYIECHILISDLYVHLKIHYEKIIPTPSIFFHVSTFFHSDLGLNVEHQTQQFVYPLFHCMMLAYSGGSD